MGSPETEPSTRTKPNSDFSKNQSNQNMSNFNGTWQAFEREGDANIMREMNLPDEVVKQFLDDKLHPVYTFAIKEDNSALDFFQMWPGQNEFLSQSAEFGKDMFDQRPDFQRQTGYSMVWNLDNENEISHSFSQTDGNGDLQFCVTTKYEIEGDIMRGTSKSDGGAKSSITLRKV